MSRVVKEAEERKEELLKIGLRFFLQGGSKNVSIQKVVNEANVATGLFYYYFKTKEDFINQALQRYLDDYIINLERIAGNKDVPILKRLDLLMKQFNVRYDEVIRVNDDEIIDTPQHHVLEGLIIQRAHKTMAEFIKEGWESGCFAIIDPGTTAFYLICGLMGTLLRANASNSNKANEEIKRLVFSTLSINENCNTLSIPRRQYKSSDRDDCKGVGVTPV